MLRGTWHNEALEEWLLELSIVHGADERYCLRQAVEALEAEVGRLSRRSLGLRAILATDSTVEKRRTAGTAPRMHGVCLGAVPWMGWLRNIVHEFSECEAL
jgi:hypothetical protein